MSSRTRLGQSGWTILAATVVLAVSVALQAGAHYGEPTGSNIGTDIGTAASTGTSSPGGEQSAAEPARAATGSPANSAKTSRVVVVDDLGVAIPGASIEGPDGPLTTDAAGRAELALATPALVRAAAPGHLPRVQALSPASTSRLVLTRSPAVSVRFGGDVMAGRRFYWPTSAAETGDPTDDAPARAALLSRDAGPAEHAALLAPIAPLLADADLTVVNLETALVADPVFDPDGPRPAWLHPTKSIAFASSTTLAEGLARSGVDVVSLANNHSFDALAAGLATTLAALDRAGVAHFGAGTTETQAWAPALLVRQGRTVAFLGCTSVTGEDHPIPYVAAADRPGAAKCTEQRLAQAVSQARTRADEVVVMIHGGVEYDRTLTPAVLRLMEIAGQAGAGAVITAHPHVIGGVRGPDGVTYADSTGNLLFDQQLWATQVGYLLRVDLAAGHTAYAQADPISLEGYRPQPLTGAPAAAVARIAAGSAGDGAQLSGTVATVHGVAAERPLTLPLAAGQIARLPVGAAVRTAAAPGVSVGTDLLWGTGDLEPATPGPSTASGGLLWDLGRYADLTSGAACLDPGAPTDSPGRGVRLLRSPVSEDDVLASTRHRIPVTPGSRLTLVAQVRSASASGVLELHWYAGAKGPSVRVDRVAVPAGEHGPQECTQVRLDVTAVDGVAYVQPFLRLPPTDDTHLGAHLLLDNVRLISWAPDGTTGPALDVVTSEQPANIVLVSSE